MLIIVKLFNYLKHLFFVITMTKGLLNSKHIIILRGFQILVRIQSNKHSAIHLEELKFMILVKSMMVSI